MLIDRAEGTVWVTLEDPTTGEMIAYPKPIDAASLEGRTITNYDWSRKP